MHADFAKIQRQGQWMRSKLIVQVDRVGPLSSAMGSCPAS